MGIMLKLNSNGMKKKANKLCNTFVFHPKRKRLEREETER
jgi:hypothetical protein